MTLDIIAIKTCSVLAEGLIFTLLAFGLFVAFRWQRFPDLTPDGSFVLGATVYAQAAVHGIPLLLALLAAVVCGAAAGALTATANRFARLPTVVAGLAVASALYSINWLLLGKPNQFLDTQFTFGGSAGGMHSLLLLLLCALGAVVTIIVLLDLFSRSITGLRLRAIGENPLLARDLGCSETAYTFLSLAIANSLASLAGALFAQRSFSADVNMGTGVTLAGLSGMLLGLLLAGSSRRIWFTGLCILGGSLLYKASIFAVLEIGMPPEAFRLLTALFLIGIFVAFRGNMLVFLRSLKWN